MAAPNIATGLVGSFCAVVFLALAALQVYYIINELNHRNDGGEAEAVTKRTCMVLSSSVKPYPAGEPQLYGCDSESYLPLFTVSVEGTSLTMVQAKQYRTVKTSVHCDDLAGAKEYTESFQNLENTDCWQFDGTQEVKMDGYGPGGLMKIIILVSMGFGALICVLISVSFVRCTCKACSGEEDSFGEEAEPMVDQRPKGAFACCGRSGGTRGKAEAQMQNAKNKVASASGHH